MASRRDGGQGGDLWVAASEWVTPASSSCAIVCSLCALVTRSSVPRSLTSTTQNLAKETGLRSSEQRHEVDPSSQLERSSVL